MRQDHIETNRNYYDTRFGSQSQKLNEEEQRRLRQILRALSLLPLPPNPKIADFGCGRGWLSSALSKSGEVSGFDLSRQAIENARANYPHCSFVALNAEGAVPPELQNSFDLVVSSEVIEHTGEQSAYLRNITLLLKPGGYLILTTPNGQWKEKFYTNGREAWKQPLENWLHKKKLLSLLTALNFEIRSSETFYSEWIFDFSPSIPAVSVLKQKITRKILKLTGLYPGIITYLNARGYGLNLLVTAKKND